MTWSTSEVAVCCSNELGEFGGALAEVSRALSQFVEQSRVLDSDDSLGGEVSNKFNLLIGEKAHLLAIKTDHAD